MNFEEFTAQALRTESIPTQLNLNPSVLAVALSLAVGVSQVLDSFKKALAYGKPVDQEKTEKLLTEILYVADVLGTLLPYANERSTDLDLGIQKSDNEGEVNGYYTEADFPLRLTHAFIGSFTEAGELIDALLSSTSHGVELDRVNIAEEYGDGDWYKAIAFQELGINETDSRQAVLDKLNRRYSAGKFTKEAALSRDLKTERAALEGAL